MFVGIAARPKPIATPKGNGYQIMQRFGSDRDAMAYLAQEMRVRLQSLAWCPGQLDPALDRGIYDRNARAQLRRVFNYVRQADGHLCRPERHQIDYVGKGQIVTRRKAPDPHFGNPPWRLPWTRLCSVPGKSSGPIGPGAEHIRHPERNIHKSEFVHIEHADRAVFCTRELPFEAANAPAFNLFAECKQRMGKNHRIGRVVLPLKPPKTVFCK